MKKLSILLILTLLIGAVILTSCDVKKDPENPDAESITTEAEATESESNTEDDGDTNKVIDPSNDATADDIYSSLEPTVIG